MQQVVEVAIVMETVRVFDKRIRRGESTAAEYVNKPFHYDPFCACRQCSISLVFDASNWDSTIRSAHSMRT